METSVLEEEKKICKECGGAIRAGRSDQKFCGDACKTSFNNRKRKAEKAEVSVPDYIRRIQETLLNNRAILESLCTEDEPGRLKMRDLLGKGFNPKFFTSEEPTKTGNLYRFCFEYGYYLNDEDYAIIVFRIREVD